MGEIDSGSAAGPVAVDDRGDGLVFETFELIEHHRGNERGGEFLFIDRLQHCQGHLGTGRKQVDGLVAQSQRKSGEALDEGVRGLDSGGLSQGGDRGGLQTAFIEDVTCESADFGITSGDEKFHRLDPLGGGFRFVARERSPSGKILGIAEACPHLRERSAGGRVIGGEGFPVGLRRFPSGRLLDSGETGKGGEKLARSRSEVRRIFRRRERGHDRGSSFRKNGSAAGDEIFETRPGCPTDETEGAFGISLDERGNAVPAEEGKVAVVRAAGMSDETLGDFPALFERKALQERGEMTAHEERVFFDSHFLELREGGSGKGGLLFAEQGDGPGAEFIFGISEVGVQKFLSSETAGVPGPEDAEAVGGFTLRNLIEGRADGGSVERPRSGALLEEALGLAGVEDIGMTQRGDEFGIGELRQICHGAFRLPMSDAVEPPVAAVPDLDIAVVTGLRVGPIREIERSVGP